MYKENLKTAAPMPKNEDAIIKNSMKLYAYLICLSGVATYPENTRMFRQKNLVLTKIQQATKITDKTAKLYLAYLEYNHKIEYQGNSKFNNELIDKYLKCCKENKTEQKKIREELQKHCLEIWQQRKKDKESIYFIRRPNPYTPVPEITLEELNNKYEVSELEMKIYLLCCGYRDDCVYYNKPFKNITFEQIRDLFGFKQKATTNKEIRMALFFLKAIGLLEFEETYYSNSKGAKIPCFKIKEVHYWITYKTKEIEKIEVIEDEEIKQVYQRLLSYENNPLNT